MRSLPQLTCKAESADNAPALDANVHHRLPLQICLQALSQRMGLHASLLLDPLQLADSHLLLAYGAARAQAGLGEGGCRAGHL